jgi:hypothetical protein
MAKIARMSKIQDSRSYGQGAKGEPETPRTQRVGLLKRLRYNFDNSLSKPGTFVGYVFLAIIILAFVMAAVQGASHLLV